MLSRTFITRTSVNYHRHRHHLPNLTIKRLISSPLTTPRNNILKTLQHAGPPQRATSSRIVFKATMLSITVAVAASYVVFFDSDELNEVRCKKDRMFKDFTIQRSNEWLRRVLDTMKHTGVAISVLWNSLTSVLSSANHEVRAGFEARVAALLADIVAADENRRAAIVGAGGGLVVDWLLDSVALNRGGNLGTQAESARALAYLIADCNVNEAVLRRPQAVRNLLRFIFSANPREQLKGSKSNEIADPMKGRSMLVAAIMDIVTSHDDNVDKIKLKPMLSRKAAMRDIAAALQVVEEGGMYWNETSSSGDGASVGLSRANGAMKLEPPYVKYTRKTKRMLFNKIVDNSPTFIPGLWDDLHCQHVAVPFAAWALANWAMASDVNRSHIQELDHDGRAIMTALVAPERSVKWHGSLVARLLLEDRNLPSNEFVPEWSPSLLSTMSQASKSDDVPLTRVALSAFLLSIERCPGAQKAVMDKSLHLMRETAKRMKKHESVQEALAKGLESLCTGNMHLSLEEGHKWSSILLLWVFGNTSSDATRSSAIRVLSRVLEDYAPSSIPISQGWLAILLSDVLKHRTATLKGCAQPKDKVKTQIDQANVVSGTQAAKQLASAVVNLTVNWLGTESLKDLLSIEPFYTSFKSIKKSVPKVNAVDSALVTLKGIKTMSEICSDDTGCQTRIIDYGVVSLLRRLLLKDDYEKLAASEVYNASTDVNNGVQHASEPSSVRVPPVSHIRRHAARFLTILSVHPKVKEFILNDKVWCDWLEDCANGKIPGCNDLKTRSYARATLLNIFCNDDDDKHRCPHFTEMIYLINPDKPHWKYRVDERRESGVDAPLDKDRINPFSQVNEGYLDIDTRMLDDIDSESVSHSDPSFDVVFVHGLRGGPFKSWRLSECKSSSKSGLVEKIDEEAGKHGTFWPAEWLSADFPHARMFTLKYKTNLTQWSGSSLPLQEVSSMLLDRLITAGIGDRPVVFVTHSMGGLVVKQMLHQARTEKRDDIVNNTIGVVFYSCPHFGSKLADLPWRMGFVLRPAPTIGELRSGSPRLLKLNDFIRRLHKIGALDVLSFCETKVTPIVEGYGGWAFRLEIVPIESSYPGYGKLVVLESTDHVNSCKPITKSDPSYSETLHLLHKLRENIHKKSF
ncbi:putative armadillo-like helical, alpha/Beta hydrolase [Helianthus debilis subsp. tardiflorus]